MGATVRMTRSFTVEKITTKTVLPPKFLKKPKVNNRQLGQKSPNLVTL
jgi:hypothetical protein